jgi:sec-independent protein translocase protein TatA
MPSIGWPELLVILVIALVIFGPKRLPDMGRQLGRGLREFRKATSEIQDHFDLDLEGKDNGKQEPVTQPSASAAPAAQPSAAASAAQPSAAAAPASSVEAPVVEPHDVVEGEIVSEETEQPVHHVAG